MADSAATASARLEDRKPLPSVGLVCICGKAVATIEGVARKCECGRLWLVTVMLLGGEREWLEGLHGPLAEKPDGDIHDYSDHPDYPSGSNSASVVIPWEDLLGGRDA